MLRLIGRGSYGDVWLAQTIMGTYRAVKVVYRSTFDHDKPYEREFEGLRKFERISLSHECQVHVLQIGQNEAEKYFYYIMELADAAILEHNQVLRPEKPIGEPSLTETLQSRAVEPGTYVPRTLQHEIKSRGRLPYHECLRIAVALSNALGHLHRNGLVHRDIKPSNIIFVNNIPKLADIGLVTDSEATVTFLGALGFMPPEGPGRPAGDIYSLGKVIYEICTGRDRLDFPALPTDFGDWPDRLQILELMAVSLRACEPLPRDRYDSAEALSRELSILQAGKSIQRLRWLERNWRWAKSALILAVITVLGAGIVNAALRYRERVKQREVWIREAQMLRLGSHQMGWSSNALQLLSQAARIRIDDDLRTQASATLSGVDAHKIRSVRGISATFLAFDAKGHRLLMDAGEGGHARLWDFRNGKDEVFQSTNTGPVWFGSDGKPYQLRSDSTGGCSLLDLEDDSLVRELHANKHYEDRRAQAISISQDGNVCAVYHTSRSNPDDGILSVWTIADGKLLVSAQENCTALALAPDGSCLATGDNNGGVHLRALPDLKKVADFQQGHSSINCVTIARDPTRSTGIPKPFPWLLSAGDAGGTINIFRISSGTLKTICRGSHYDIYSVAFSPDGMTLASAGRRALKLWDVATGRDILTAPGFDFGVTLAFSPSGDQIAAGTLRGFGESVVGVTQIASDRGVRELRGLTSQLSKVEFSHQGRHLAALSHNWEVGIWNIESNRLECVLEEAPGLTADNAALAFSPNDEEFAFATYTNASLWEVKTGRLLRTWSLPEGLVQQLCFDTSGRLLHFQWEKTPGLATRICRVRDLLNPGNPVLVSQFPSPGGRILDVALSGRGDSIAIVAAGTNGADIVRILDPLTGRDLASLPATGRHDSDRLSSNPQATLVAYWLGADSGTGIFELPGGARRGKVRVDEIQALSPDNNLFVSHPPESTVPTLSKMNDPAWHLVLDVDRNNSSVLSRFSRDGKFFAWGTAEGIVIVCNLDEVLQNLRLAGIGP